MNSTTPPPRKVEAMWPFARGKVWRSLWGSGLQPRTVDCYFKLIHHILLLRGRLASLGIVADGVCGHYSAW
jgi:hypothetical protein